MDCKKFDKLLVRYLEGDLNAQDKSSIEKHLQECRRCEGEFLLLKQILEIAKFEKIPSPSEDYWADYTAKLWQRIGRHFSRHFGLPRRLADEASDLPASAAGNLPRRQSTSAAEEERTPISWDGWMKPLRWAALASVLVIFIIFYFQPGYRTEKFVPPSAPEAAQPGLPKITAKTGTKPATITSKNLINLAEGIDEFYNPAVDTTEVIDTVYAQATDIDNILKERIEEKDCFSLVDELSPREKKKLIRKISKILQS